MEALETLADKFNYWVYIVIMMIGLYAMVSKNNLIKKLIGMSIFQTAIILFYVSIGYKDGATIPILYHDQVHGAHHAEEGDHSDEAVHHDEEHAVEAIAKDAIHHEEGYGTQDLHETSHQDISPIDAHMMHNESDHALEAGHGGLSIDPNQFENPLVHVLMLTAIVVGVATLGVGLAISQKLYGEFGTIEENEIIEQLRTGND